MRKGLRFFPFLVLILTIVNLKVFIARTVYAADCGSPVPPAPVHVTAVTGPGSGEVTLYWEAAPYANRYAVAYGTESNRYLYGAENIGGSEARSYTVKSLNTGTRYYFRLAAARDCSSSPLSGEVSAVTAGGLVVSSAVAQVKEVKAVQPVRNVQPVRGGFMGVAGPNAGEVTLFPGNSSAENYHLVYGWESGKYIYGALNLGKFNKYTVKSLIPGRTYHFALIPVAGGVAQKTTGEIAVSAMADTVQVVNTSPEALIPERPFTPPQVTPPPEIFSNPTAAPSVVNTTSDNLQGTVDQQGNYIPPVTTAP